MVSLTFYSFGYTYINIYITTRPGCAFVVFPSRKVGQHVGRPTVSHLVVVDKNEYGTFSKYIKNS